MARGISMHLFTDLEEGTLEGQKLVSESTTHWDHPMMWRQINTG